MSVLFSAAQSWTRFAILGDCILLRSQFSFVQQVFRDQRQRLCHFGLVSCHFVKLVAVMRRRGGHLCAGSEQRPAYPKKVLTSALPVAHHEERAQLRSMLLADAYTST